MLVHSANDAANVLAYHISGSIDAFATLMNNKVTEFGLENTHFTSTDQLRLGDEVIVYGNILNYSGTMEMNSGNYIYSLNGVTTGINGVVADEVNADAPVYNLAGQRVNKNVKGILIKNGKAFINK